MEELTFQYIKLTSANKANQGTKKKIETMAVRIGKLYLGRIYLVDPDSP